MENLALENTQKNREIRIGCFSRRSESGNHTGVRYINGSAGSNNCCSINDIVVSTKLKGWKTMSNLENHVISRKLCHFAKTMSYRENWYLLLTENCYDSCLSYQWNV